MKVSLLHRPGTCSLKDMLRAWSACMGKATALPEEKTFSGWAGLVSGGPLLGVSSPPASPGSLYPMLAGLTRALFIPHRLRFFLFSQCCQFFL